MSNDKPRTVTIPNNGFKNINIKQKPFPNNVIMKFIINGKVNEVKVDLNDKIKLAVFEVFRRNKIEQKLDNWTIKTESGVQLDFTKSYAKQGITKTDALFLSKGPGRGG